MNKKRIEDYKLWISKNEDSRNHGELDKEETNRIKSYYSKKHDGILDEEMDMSGKSLEDLAGNEEIEDFEEEEPVENVTIEKTKDIKTGEGYSEDDLNADMENMAQLVREFFKNSDIETQIMYNGLDIDIYVFLHKREKIKAMYGIT